MTITSRFSGLSPVSMAQGRHGELIVVQGKGVRPARWTGSGAAVDAGMDAPKTAPAVTAQTPANYYIARVDVTKPGACYYAPPEVTFTSEGTRSAKASSYLNQSGVSEIRVTDGGKGYAEQPSVELSDTYGKGAEITAILDEPEDTTTDSPTNSQKTGLTGWSIVQGPPFDDELDLEPLYKTKWLAYGAVTIPIENGSGSISKRLFINLGQECNGKPQQGAIDIKVDYTVSGVKNGSNASVRVGFAGHAFLGANCTQNGTFCLCAFDFLYSSGVSGVSASKYGAGYADDETVTVTIPAFRSWDGTKYVPSPDSKALIIEGTTRGNPRNTTARGYPIKELTLKSGGSGYLVAPQIKITSNSGFGAYATCKVKNGAITEVALENSGGGYKSEPKIEILSGGAEAFAVSRPHLRGSYQCYYRYVDDTPEERGGPIPSNLSPLKEIDAGEGASSVTWTAPAPTGRAKKVELWRSTGNEATTLYRAAVRSSASGYVDNLTDEELRDPDRKDYAAMPVVLPNGELNANRFGVPPSDKSVVVRFQDRMWYGVDTGGKEPNTIFYSEVDEPESVPDANEIILQQNARDADSLRAMIPFGSTLLLMQERHSFSLTFAKNPVLDAQVTPVAYRGCLNQRCWDIYGGVCYVLDQYGVYAIQPTGQVESLSDAIDNLFRDHVDYAKSTWFFALVDAKTKVLRVFLSFKEDSSAGYPTRVLCYSLDAKAWWVEKYPQRLTGGSQVRLANGDFRCVYAAQSGPMLLDEGHADIARGSVVSVSLINGGTGYRTPPTVRAVGGSGAEFQASINSEGSLTAIWVVSPGYGYTSGDLVIGPPNDPSVENAVQAKAIFKATSASDDMPLCPTYRFKGGCAEYVTDAMDPKAAGESSRNITLAYDPQPSACDVSLRTYYNNAPSPRPNVALRDRGAGFSHSTVDAAARYDMSAATTKTGYDSGMATAMFAGRTLADIRSGDRHVAVELVGARKTPKPVTFYTLDIAGTAGK